jgi:hypothetical protein
MVVGVSDIAEAVHEVNRVVQRVQAEQGVKGIDVAPPWAEVPPEMQQSVIEGVEGILAGRTPQQSHEAWCNFKLARGWTYGEVKDAEAKTHPCLLPYDTLPEDQKLKDYVFRDVVLALVHAFGSVAP